MMDLIRILPESVANQIAAGEVVQRPASVVKELMENSLDAGASQITVVVKQAGKRSIQVIDNGCGMSANDARLAFSRHATSKIKEAEDLFHIHTMGFRGEALASIASVAEAELTTRRPSDELGYTITITGNRIQNEAPITCAVGCRMTIQNLFYNIPARRKFLKSDAAELKAIVQEFLRVALTREEIRFTLIHNDEELYDLFPGTLHDRLCGAFGRSLATRLIPVTCDTDLVKIGGYVTQPDQAKKSWGEQYFFVNRRYMRHSLLHKAVVEAYGDLLRNETIPSYFLYFEINTERIDVNIHPTKTEVKFDDEGALFQIVRAAIRESLGRYNVTPSIDFDREGEPQFNPQIDKVPTSTPAIDYDPLYNPFREHPVADSGYQRPTVPSNWQSLYEGLKKESPETVQQTTLFEQSAPQKTTASFLQYNRSYIVASVDEGIYIIDQRRASERLQYESYLRILSSDIRRGQTLLFPEEISLSAEEDLALNETLPYLSKLGYNLEACGNRTYNLNSAPTDLSSDNTVSSLMSLLDYYMGGSDIPLKNESERVALALAKTTATPRGKALSFAEMAQLFEALFALDEPRLTPEDRPIYTLLTPDELLRRLS